MGQPGARVQPSTALRSAPLPCAPADLRCWAFNPPGGLVSWELAQIAQAYCTSIVVGKDVISRLRRVRLLPLHLLNQPIHPCMLCLGRWLRGALGLSSLCSVAAPALPPCDRPCSAAPSPRLLRRSFNTSKRVVDEMVVSLARCTRPKLRLAADVALGRRKRADATPTTFCSFADIQPEAMELVEG